MCDIAQVSSFAMNHALENNKLINFLNINKLPKFNQLEKTNNNSFFYVNNIK
jgi:hypothetical protein